MMAEYRRGQGPNALPQGGAAQVNRQTPRPAPLETQVPVQYAPEGDVAIPDEIPGASETKQVLLQGPHPRFEPSEIPLDRAGRVPRYVVRHLPQLAATAKDPMAPPALRAMYAAVLRQLELERIYGGG